MLPQYLKSLPNMSHVRNQIPTVHQNVIKKNDNKIVQLLPKDTVHEVHKSRGSVRQSKREDQKLKMAIPRSESCLMDVWGMDSDLMIATS